MRVERGNRGVEEGLRTCESRRTKGMNDGRRTRKEERRKNEERRWMNERRTGKVRVNANEKGERKWARTHTQTKTHGTARHDTMRAAFWNEHRCWDTTQDRTGQTSAVPADQTQQTDQMDQTQQTALLARATPTRRRHEDESG